MYEGLSENEKALLRQQVALGVTCTHAEVEITYVGGLQQLEMYCPQCDNLLIYTQFELRQAMAQKLMTAWRELGGK